MHNTDKSLAAAWTMAAGIVLGLCLPGSALPAVDPALEYLGQDPPGLTPQCFPPDSLLATADGSWHGGPVFSPDLDEMYWTWYDDSLPSLWTMEIDGDAWGPAHRPSFADPAWGENYPCFSTGGDSLWFVSDRPPRGIYLVTRIADDWSTPVRVDVPQPEGTYLGWQVAVTRDASIYYELWLAGDVDLWVTRPVGGLYPTSQRLPDGVNTTGYEFAPWVHPDEKYLIFSSNRPGGYGFNDLYVSFGDTDGNWLSPQNMGPVLNTAFEDCFPVVSPDGDWFFLTRQMAGDLGFNPYWVDSVVIDDFRPAAVDAIPPGRVFTAGGCAPNPFNPSTNIHFVMHEAVAVNLRIYDPAGRLVRSLVVGEVLARGPITIRWHGDGDSGRAMPSGVYCCRLEAGGETAVMKLVLVR